MNNQVTYTAQAPVYAATPYVPVAAGPQQVIYQQQQPNPDQDYLVACCATYCCACLGCIMYCIKPNIHTGMGMVGGFGCSFLIAGILILAVAGMANSDMDSTCDYKRQDDGRYSYDGYETRDSCLDAFHTAIRVYNGVGATCLVLGIILFPFSLWRHSVAKSQGPTAVVFQQPMYAPQPMYAQPPAVGTVVTGGNVQGQCVA
eukprot:PhF_6_TR9934/c0_g1_i1/m.15118